MAGGNYFVTPEVSPIENVNISDEKTPISVYFSAYGGREQYNEIKYVISNGNVELKNATIRTYKNTFTINKDAIQFQDGEKYSIKIAIGKNDEFGSFSQPVYFNTYKTPYVLLNGMSASQPNVIKTNTLTTKITMDNPSHVKETEVSRFNYILYDNNGNLLYETPVKYQALSNSEHTFNGLEPGITYYVCGVVALQNRITIRTPKYRFEVEFVRPTTNAKMTFFPDAKTGDVKVVAKLTSIKGKYEKDDGIPHTFIKMGDKEYAIDLTDPEDNGFKKAVEDTIRQMSPKPEKLSRLINDYNGNTRFKDSIAGAADYICRLVEQRVIKLYAQQKRVHDKRNFYREMFVALSEWGINIYLDNTPIYEYWKTIDRHPHPFSANKLRSPQPLRDILSEVNHGLFYDVPSLVDNDFSLEMWFKIPKMTGDNMTILYLKSKDGSHEFILENNHPGRIVCIKHWGRPTISNAHRKGKQSLFYSNDIGKDMVNKNIYVGIEVKNHRVGITVKDLGV